MVASLSVQGLCAWYGDRQTLRDVAFATRPGRVLAVLGPSGCGKSTLLACIDRTLELTTGTRWTGSVRLGEQDLGTLAADDARALVGLVTQQPCPFPLSVLRNLAYVPRYRGVRGRAGLTRIAVEALRQVGLYDELGGDLKRSALTLSGGQQQRLCIARALTAEPQALLLDEPCSSLDVASTASVEETIIGLKDRCAIVLVTHNLGQARRVADDVLCLSAGRVAWQGPAEELFAETGPGAAVLEELYS
ncbi:ATP-binding cassette domain-containing protein [Olsenella sp. YH-ols2217]|uniref:ATP-binding cassette domain-containing protein n=1 Tax=Kribbibacterium absianum TaxID=3044210 RepID=A0ABT6ZJZ4_9ACTN|nr:MULTISPECIES: ATP-binding cassette domain-containing protein [unclassified Olsenella]MDJ1122376.1 ATP-binding cassette domain-containing protein [Olsenella sp. YH-ols2216]MDJ1129370.1 ATP-binding cassette domain-containing protein [Olsenella sp. YH-ols2217]